MMKDRSLLVTVVVVLRFLMMIQIVTGLSSPPQSRSTFSALKSSDKPFLEIEGASSTSTIFAEENNHKISIEEKDKNDDDNSNELESNVIISIQNAASAASNLTENPQKFFSALGDFGQSSGALISKKWLTPEALEECTLFWDDGFRILMRDLFRSYVFSQKSTRYRLEDWVALGWFTLLASSSSLIFFPLLLPLIQVGLKNVGENGIDESIYVPPSFGTTRLTAMRRLRSPKEKPLSRYLAGGTPRNVEEGISFFKDGTLLLARDVKRGTLTSREDDTWGSYGWFSFLAFSSFPLTPLIIPLIDKRRNGENDKTSDYVPSSYRPERLRALTRLRNIKAFKFGRTPIETLRAVTNEEKIDRPPPEMILEAILKVQQSGGKQDKSHFLEALAGFPGRRWELAYIAGKPAVVDMRKKVGETKDGNSGDSWYRPIERLMLPWTRLRDGLYIDSNLVSAIQNFDARTMKNKNGVFQILRSDFFQTTVEGPFSWDGDCQITKKDNNDGQQEKRKRNAAICAFRPTKATFQLGSWKINQDIPEEVAFDQTHIRDLPFFKFIHVDDKVAVAMGRSGSVALWIRMDDVSQANNI